MEHRDEEAKDHGRTDGVEHRAAGPFYDAVFASFDGCAHVDEPQNHKGTDAHLRDDGEQDHRYIVSVHQISPGLAISQVPSSHALGITVCSDD